MYNAAQHKGWSKQHKDKSRASPSRLTWLLPLTDMTLTMWHDWRDIECHSLAFQEKEEEIFLRVRKFLYICNVLCKKHRHFICSIATRTRPSTREKRALLYHQRLAPKCRLPIGGIRLA